MFPARTVEEYKKSIKLGTQPTKYHNYYAQFQPGDRASLGENIRVNKTKEERLEILKNLL